MTQPLGRWPLLAACLMILAPRTSLGHQPAPALSAEAEWERAVDAKGGRDALRAVKTFVRKRTAEGVLTHRRDYIEQLVIPPSRLWSWYDVSPEKQFGQSVRVIDVERHYRRDALKGMVVKAATMPSRSDVHMLRDLLICTLLDVPSVTPDLRRASADGRYIRLDATLDDQLYTIYLDRRTHLPAKVVSRVETPRGLAGSTYDLSDYAVVGGIQLPHAVHSQMNNAAAFKEHVQYEINVAYDERVFSDVPSLANGPEAWKLPRS